MDEQLKLASNGNACNRGVQLRLFGISGQICLFLFIKRGRKRRQLIAKNLVYNFGWAILGMAGLLDTHKQNLDF